MDFSLECTGEEEAFAEEVRRWLQLNAPDNVDVRDAQRMTFGQFKALREFAGRLGRNGWLHPGYPREYGGGGLDAGHCYVLKRELARRKLTLPPVMDAAVVAVPAVLACGTEDQKKRLLPPMLRGEALTWQLMTEPEAGTDEANQQTNALRYARDGEQFIVNGQKIFVGGLFPPPDQFYLLTRSDLTAPRHRNLSSFIVPADLPGVTIQPLDLFPLGTFASASGPTGTNTDAVKNSVFFDDVRVHESCLIGKEGEGWRVTQASFGVEHGGSGAIVHNYIAEEFLTQCRVNSAVRGRLAANPMLLDAVVSVYVSAQIERLLSLRNAAAVGGPYAGPQLALHQKSFGATFIAEMAKVLGPVAFVDGTEWMLGDGIFEVAERCGICVAPGGTPEAMKIIMARALAIGR